MTSVLLIFHVFGLMLASAGAFGGVMSLAYAKPAQKQKGGPVRGIGVVFTNLSIFGLVLLWPSGIALVVTSFGDAPMDSMFWMKMGFALLASFATVSMQMIYSGGRKNPHNLRLMPSLHPLAAICYVMTAVFSVLTFGVKP
jgi:hypothetical protein